MSSSINIYDASGELLRTVTVTKEAEHEAELMTSDFVTLSWRDTTGETLPIGSYIAYEGKTYRLIEPYKPDMKSDAEYRYEPEFHSDFMCLQMRPFFFLDLDTEGNITSRETSWDLTATIGDFLDNIVASILDETGETYTYSLDSSLTGSKTLSFENADIISGLNQICSDSGWDCEWWVIDTVIHVGTAKFGDSVTLEVGKNITYPTSINRSSNGYYTRFYAFGSTHNITQEYQSGKSTNYVVDKRLALPAATCPNGYKDISEDLTDKEIAVKVLIFDDIYPRSYLTVSDVKQEIKYYYDSDGNKVVLSTAADGTVTYQTYAIFFFKIDDYNFDEDDIIDGETLTAYFSSGNLQGWEFELGYDSENKEFEIILDESTGTIIPNEILIPAAGDSVVLCGIEMPTAYVTAAEDELEEALDKAMPQYYSDFDTYTVKSNPVQFNADGTRLKPGMVVTYICGNYTLETRVLKVVEKLDFPCVAEIEFSEEQKTGSITSLKEEVATVSNSVKALSALTDVYNAIINSLSSSSNNMAARLLGYWKKTELVKSGNYLYFLNKKVHAGYADKAGKLTHRVKGKKKLTASDSRTITVNFGDTFSEGDVIQENFRVYRYKKYKGKYIKADVGYHFIKEEWFNYEGCEIVINDNVPLVGVIFSYEFERIDN